MLTTLPDLQITRATAPVPDPFCAEAERADDVLGVLYGHFSVFNTWYRIASFWEGEFLERVAPGSFSKTMKERRSQIVAAFDHGFDPVIGDKVLGPFRELKEDSTGAYYEVDLLDTSYNRDLEPALRRGLYSASFRFQVIKDEWNEEPGESEHNPKGIPERTVREVRLFEAGPVTYPANPDATAAMRSTTDAYYERMSKRDPDRVAALRSSIVDLRTVRPDVAETAAPHDPNEPLPSTRQGLSPRARREALYPYLKGDQR